MNLYRWALDLSVEPSVGSRRRLGLAAGCRDKEEDRERDVVAAQRTLGGDRGVAVQGSQEAISAMKDG